MGRCGALWAAGARRRQATTVTRARVGPRVPCRPPRPRSPPVVRRDAAAGRNGRHGRHGADGHVPGRHGRRDDAAALPVAARAPARGQVSAGPGPAVPCEAGEGARRHNLRCWIGGPRSAARRVMTTTSSCILLTIHIIIIALKFFLKRFHVKVVTFAYSL